MLCYALAFGLECYQCPSFTSVSDCYTKGDDYGDLTTCPAGVTTCYNNWSGKFYEFIPFFNNIKNLSENWKRLE